MKKTIENTTNHRDISNLNYMGIPIHTLPGLHELVFSLIKKYCSKSCSIIELGAGSGAMTKRLTDSNYLVTAVELDAKDWCLALTPIIADFNDVDWKKNLIESSSFSAAVAIEVIEHLENPSKFFRDIADVLEDDGYLILTTPNILFFDSLMHALKTGNFCMYSAEEAFTSGHITLLPWWMTKHIGEQNGFELKYVSGASPWLGNYNYKYRFFRWFVEKIIKREFFDDQTMLKDFTNIVFVFKKI